MKIDTKLIRPTAAGADYLGTLAQQSRAVEDAGYDGIWSTESSHDPFLPLVTTAQATSRLRIGTAIAVAFARNPMTLAYTAHDLQVASGGRFMLGLGSQIKPHIERRFSMPWSHPARRMREFIEALRAIWSSWESGERLSFRGDFYSHTLMTPFFSPGPSPYGPPEVYLAAVGDQMTAVAGEVCDGFMPHPFTTLRYLEERTLPTLRRGLADRGRTLDDLSISFSGLVASGRTEEELAAAVRAVRDQIAFYGSTPAYHPVLALHGWGDLGQELNRLSRTDDENRWRQMGDLIDDEVLHTFAVVSEPDRVGAEVAARWGSIADRFHFYAPYPHDSDLWKPALAALGRSER
ncbi:TIGR03617 family F420-dependent LLM class oxidoreductase [Cryptosporangium sp. NPDC051539]|uniref:TIGR03617 family F420-dependent LLM class oxidoreductase n=1 Tax=Cryptosporangium sp. NPDC051539 TaxID=3363962 RepID=UPI0037AA683D